MKKITLVILIIFALHLSAYAVTDKTGQPIVNQPINTADAVNIALENNPMIAAKQAETSAAIARLGMIKAVTRPQLSATGFATLSNMQMVLPGSPGVEPQNFALTADQPQLSGNLMAMFPLFTGGKLKGQVKSAAAIQQATTADVFTTRLDVILQVKTAYYAVLLQCKVVEAQEQHVTEAKERMRVAEAAYNAGAIAKYDLLRNQTELAEAEQMLNMARLDQAMALIDLKSMMGISQSSQIQLTSELTYKDAVPPFDDLIAVAVERSSEVAAARARVASAESDLRVAKSAYKPQIYASAMSGPALTSGDGSANGYLVGLTASIPLIDGGQRKSAVKEAQAMIDQMCADERQTVLNVSKDVAVAFEKLCTASKNVSLAQAAIVQAEEDYRVVNLRYEAGKATNVEVLDALASLTRARTNYAQALYGYNVARDTLTRATGGE